MCARRASEPSATKCARSRCKKPAVKVPGREMELCVHHHVALGRARPKYGNQKAVSTMVGRRFDSQGERDYCEGLFALAEAGKITNLRFQTTHKLEVNGRLVCGYRSDADYTDENGVYRVTDFKGYETEVFRLKAKLFEAVFGFPITVVRAKRGRR